MKTKKLRLISALLAVAMMVLLAPTAALAATKTTADGFEYEVTMDGEAYIIGYNGSATEVEIPSTLDGKTVTKIGSHDIIYTIWGNNQVTSVKIPSTVKTIEAGVFAGCTNLTTVDLSEAESLDSIGAYAFQDSGLTSVCIPANVAEISLGAFYGCKNLQTVDLSKAIDLKVIGVDAFSGIIGNEPSIAEITIPAGVTEIGRGAFGGCSQLTKVIFESPSKLNDVDEDAFKGCSNATIYYSDEAVKTALSGKVGSAKMVKCAKVTFDPNGGSEVKAKMVEKGQKADPPTNPTRSGWDFAGWYTKSADGKWADEKFDFSKAITDDMTLYARWTVDGKCGNNLTWILDSDGTMTISGTGAMADYDSHYNQPWVDQRSNIKHLVVENGVTSIGDCAFNNCTALKDADMSKAMRLKTIDKDAFTNCSELENVSLPMDGELEEIQYNAFSFYDIGDKNLVPSIKKIIIPTSVRKIDTYAFDGCKELTTVIFAKGSQLAEVGYDAFRNCSNVTIYYSDETVKTALMKGGVDANKIKPLTPTVTFISNGGSEVASQKVANRTAVTKPTAPTREGYVFDDWYTDEKLNEKYDFSKPVTDDMTLYAKWLLRATPIGPAIRLYPIAVDCGTAYDAEGNPIEKAAAGDVVTIKADETAFDGMAFERWEVRKGEVKLENDRAAETTFTMPAGEVQLEAMPRLESPDDSGWDAATVVTGAVIGTGTAILAYHIGMEVYAEQVLGKDVAVPRTRGEVALLAWQLAGSPEPNAAFELLTDEAKAQQWAVESGLLQPDAEGNFHAEKKLSKLKALRVLDKAKKQV